MRNRKKFIVKSLLMFMLLSLGVTINACEIDFHIDGEQQSQYKKNDVLVVKVKITFTHRVCPEGIEKTKFTYKGVKITGATKWVETGLGIWERKLKVQFTESGDNLKLNALRACDKDGGLGSITFNAK